MGKGRWKKVGAVAHYVAEQINLIPCVKYHICFLLHKYPTGRFELYGVGSWKVWHCYNAGRELT